MSKMLASALVLCVLCQAAMTLPSSFLECPQLFVLLNGRCYHFGSQQSTWYEAFLQCTKLRSYLIGIDSSRESFTIITYLMSLKGGKVGWWTSGNDEELEGKWVWIGSQNHVRFSRWCTNQPDNYNKSENCLHITHMNDEICWNDKSCLSNTQNAIEPLYYICETDPYNTRWPYPK